MKHVVIRGVLADHEIVIAIIEGITVYVMDDGTLRQPLAERALSNKLVHVPISLTSVVSKHLYSLQAIHRSCGSVIQNQNLHTTHCVSTAARCFSS